MSTPNPTHHPQWMDLFRSNLEAAITFHRLQQSDPHGVSTPTMVALTEVRDAFEFAARGIRTPKCVIARSSAPTPDRGAGKDNL